jgi:hypothetical protein
MLAALTAALTLAVLLTQEIGTATINSMHDRAKAQSDACAIDGGKATKEYEFSRGSTEWTSITMKCKGGKSDGWTCVNTPSKTECTRPLTRPEESPYGDVPGGGTNAPASENDPYGGTATGGTYATDGSAADGGQTSSQDSGTVAAEEAPAPPYPYRTQGEAEEDTAPITPVQSRRISSGDEEL